MKKFIILSTLITLTYNLFSQTGQNLGELKGVVTYYFNEYQGDKPDIGSSVLIAPTDSIDHHDVFDIYLTASSRLFTYNHEKDKKIKQLYFEELKRLNCETKQKYDTLDTRANAKLVRFQRKKDVKELIVDGSGNYSIKLKPGTYEILIVSKNRQGITLTEVMGKIGHKFVTINSDETELFNTRFDQY